MNVDWSKAPGGFPIWVEDLKRDQTFDRSGWHADRGDRYEDQSGSYWLKSDDDSFRVHERPATPQWNGEGLPPVGAVVEWSNRLSPYGWTVGQVIAHDGKHAVIKQNANSYLGRHPSELRPIRTPEQLAAEASEREIVAMISDMDAGFRYATARQIAEKLYDAGYRKKGQPE